MGRRRTDAVPLPEGVQIVKKPNGRAYYYWAPKRGSKAAGPRVPLGSDTEDPRFWQALRKARAATVGAGTFDALIDAFRSETNPDWTRLRPATRKDYSSYLDRLAAQAGDRLVSALTKPDVYAMRDGMAATPVAANHMLSVLQTIVEWGVPRGYRDDNPVIGVKRLDVEAGGAAPWPEDGYRAVLATAPPDLSRMAFLGRATGQRAGDLVRMKPAHMEADGINVWIGKRRETKHFVPLTKDQVREIMSWGVGDMDYFIKSTRGKPYTATHLNSRWNRWRASRDAAALSDVAMTIHGLRASKVADLAGAGLSDRAIGDEIGMSAQMVRRYLRFSDKTAMARASRDRREQAGAEYENQIVILKTHGV